MELGNICFGHSQGTFPVSREYTDLFHWFLERIGCSHYGTYEFESADFNHGGYENNVFRISPYCWCMQDGGCNNCVMPNFWYKPDNFRIDWYKYPFRDSYSNKPFNLEYFYKILVDCERSWGEENWHKKSWDFCGCGRRKEKNLYKCWKCAITK